ncbi:MAG: BLUF domain-containing protein [Bacteroidetes bacterium]|nr:BLUF domain-containing protein [Bacteroidota bacterium]
MEIFYILYLSAVADWFNEDELETILAASRRNNQQDDITGVLLYGRNNFIQLLEGPAESVKKTFERIKTDKRHLDVTVIVSGKLKERCYPEWFMGFRAIKPESYANMSGFINLSKQATSNNDCELPVRLLDSFIKKNRLDS